MIYNDSFRVRISTAYGLAITLIRACAKTEKGSIYFMDTNESALFAETLERILHQTDCAALDNFCDTSLDFNYCISHEDECIEIVIKGRYSYSKHSYHLSHIECQNLILEIYKKLDELKVLPREKNEGRFRAKNESRKKQRAGKRSKRKEHTKERPKWPLFCAAGNTPFFSFYLGVYFTTLFEILHLFSFVCFLIFRSVFPWLLLSFCAGGNSHRR